VGKSGFQEGNQSMKIGVVACNILQRELDKLLAEMPEIAEVIYLDGALHVIRVR
jgi:gluconate kinase